MRKKLIPIKGMHCRSCELLIEEELKKLPSVYFVGISYKKNIAEIHSHEEVSNDLIYKAVAEAGYSVGKDEKKAWLSRDPNQYKDLFSAFIVIIVLYLFLRIFSLTDIKFNFGEPSSLLVVLLVGLTAGISTCMALVGGLIVSISARHAEKHPEATAIQKFRPHVFFNIGRILSYTILGGFIGLIGKAFQFSGPTLGVLTLIVGLVMLTLGLQLIEVFPKISGISFSLPSGISKALGIKKHHAKEYSHSNSILIGALTFFLPCGFTQAMQIYAMSTGSFVSGALIMGVFALGTAPGLLGIGGLTSVIKGSFSKKFFKFVGLVVISLAIFSFSNAFNLFGWRINLPRFQNSSSAGTNESFDSAQDLRDPNVKIEDGKQVVRMVEDSQGYSPNIFTVKRGIPVKWVIDAQNIYSCASSLVSRELKLSTVLKSGENVFEFIPNKVGEISFSCSMGMYRGKFIIVDENGAQAAKPAEEKEDIQITPPPSEDSQPTTQVAGDVQVLKTTFFSNREDIRPYEFKVKVGKPVELDVDVKETSYGCMSTIMIPDLVNAPQPLIKDEPVKLAFTPTKKGTYYITCAMGIPRGEIIVE